MYVCISIQLGDRSQGQLGSCVAGADSQILDEFVCELDELMVKRAASMGGGRQRRRSGPRCSRRRRPPRRSRRAARCVAETAIQQSSLKDVHVDNSFSPRKEVPRARNMHRIGIVGV